MASGLGLGPDKLGKRSMLGLELWSVWEAVRRPTLCCGAQSEVQPDTIRRMVANGPPTKVVELAGIGHAPSLMTPDQIEILREFLEG